MDSRTYDYPYDLESAGSCFIRGGDFNVSCDWSSEDEISSE